jgi:hypothetical protein
VARVSPVMLSTEHPERASGEIIFYESEDTTLTDGDVIAFVAERNRYETVNVSVFMPNFVFTGDAVVETIDGVNKVFTLHNNFIVGSTRVFLNSLRLTLVNDYAELSPNQLEFVDAPLPGDTIIVDYFLVPESVIQQANNRKINIK